MTTTTVPPTVPPTGAPRRPVRVLTRHYLEMVAAMFGGMLVLGALRELAGLTVAFADRPGTSFLLMATDMTLGMGLWMSLRRHDRACTLQMCAAMYTPVAFLPLLSGGIIGATTFLVVAHVLMMVAMLAVLLRHRDRMLHCHG